MQSNAIFVLILRLLGEGFDARGVRAERAAQAANRADEADRRNGPRQVVDRGHGRGEPRQLHVRLVADNLGHIRGRLADREFPQAEPNHIRQDERPAGRHLFDLAD